MRRKEPTSTRLVFELLIGADDFRTSRQIQAELGLDVNHVTAALCHLRKHQAIDCLESSGALWWYATPTNDTRTRTLAERTPEARPRRPRRPKKLIKPHLPHIVC